MFIKSEKYIGFDDRWLLLIGIPLGTIFSTLAAFGDAVFTRETIPCAGIAFVFTTIYWLGYRHIIVAYHKRFPDYNFSRKRLVFIVGLMGAYYVIIKIVVGFIIHGCFPQHANYYHDNNIGPITTGMTEILLIALVFFIYEGIYYLNKSRMIEIEKNKLEKMTAEQKLSTLKNQVNPHFLFNSLNTLVTLIPEDKNQAIQFVQELSKTYRTILEVRDEKLITIEKELAALESYIYLLKTRFFGKIQIDNRVPLEQQQEFILPISLQILIENAVKHNIVSTAKPLKIELFVQDDYLVVSNNLQLKKQEFVTTKVGLTNIISRYKFMTEKDVLVIKNKVSFVVKLPIIKNIKA